MTKSVTVKDGQKYTNSDSSEWVVAVISGTPVMEYSLDNFATTNTLDLTVSSTYPNAIVTLPECKFRFNLSGAVVQISQL